MLTLTAIIPNYNRADALPPTLVSLAEQEPGGLLSEIIVVDDGSTDDSPETVRRALLNPGVAVKLLEQEHKGPGAARNLGARHAGGDLLLFWDSDMIASSGALAAHQREHLEGNNRLVAGSRKPWPGAIGNTFMRLFAAAEPGADQSSGKIPSFQEAFSSNLSIHKALFTSLGGFDEQLWAYEDVDLAYRAGKHGAELFYSREALGYHNHTIALEDACRQQHFYQKYAAWFLQKHPELEGEIRHLRDKGPVQWGGEPLSLSARKVARQLLALPIAVALMKRSAYLLEQQRPNDRLLVLLYRLIIGSCQLSGYREGLKLPMPHAPA